MKSAASPFQIILKLLLQWWWLILIAVGLGAGVGYFIRSNQPDVYYAKSTVLFNQNVFNSGVDIQSLAEIGGVLNLYAALARRDFILQPVIDQLNLNQSIQQLNERLSVEPALNLPLLEVTVADTSPLVAANIANAVAQEIINSSPTARISQEDEFKRIQLRDLQSQIENLKSNYDQLIAQGASLTSAFEIAQNLEQQEKTLTTMQALQTLYADMSAGLEDRSGQLSILEPASADTAGVVSGSALSVVISALAGLVLALTTIVLLWYFDNRLEFQEGVDEIHGVKVLGPLGLIPRNKLPLYVFSMPETIESEVLRQLRGRLVLASGGEQPKVVTITSYDSGDGKTVTAANMALLAAKSGLRTVLVDGDIRKGDSHEIFQLPNVMGVSDVLASHESIPTLLKQALLESGYDNLTILTSGRSTADPAALLSGPRFSQMIESLKKQFDTIVVDSVPTIGGPDSAFIAETSDGVVIVVHAQRTTQKALERTLQSLRRGRNVNIYGVVFNRVPLQVTSSYNQPYYRRTLTISPDRFKQELANAQKSSRFGFNRNIMSDKNGELLYSYAAAAVHLGVSEESLNNWVKVGYLTPERRGRRQWIRQSDIERLLERVPRHTAEPRPVRAADAPMTAEAANGKATGKIPDLSAVLGYARKPDAPEDVDA